MSKPRLGIWLIGARGGIATTLAGGLTALRKRLSDDCGLVSMLPKFAHLPLVDWDQLVVGGHEIRETSLWDEALRLHRDSRVLDVEVLDACRDDLQQIDTNIRPGVLWNVGDTIRQLATGQACQQASSAKQAVAQVQADLSEFRRLNELDDVIVVNVASTEPLIDEKHWPETWAETERLLEQPNCPLPASSLYAIGALDLGIPYINFTPSLGATPLGIDQLARERGTCHAGRDGKTGETLLKSVLAPMFAARNLEVMSWVGCNIFGNLDSQVLDDPQNKAAKAKCKDQQLASVLGYSPETVVSIEHVASLGDRKTAWDHVHFRGFLNTPMTLQFTWQGCDSLLAAPLVLDLIRFTHAAQGHGAVGPLSFLSSFFKSPIGTSNQVFSDQFRLLEDWSEGLR